MALPVADDAPRRSFGPWLLPLLSLGLFLAAAWAIHRELAAWRVADVAAAVEALPTAQLAVAVGRPP
jgi:hypothetical protein